MYAFDFEIAEDLEQAVAALSDEDALALAGGQTLIPSLKQRLNAPAKLVSLTRIAALQQVTETGSELTIGASVNHARVAAEAGSYPALAGLAGGIGDPAVRNRGTLGGSLANNDPSACYPAAVLASGAVISTNQRDIEAEAFFQGMFTTDLEEGEIITSVRFPIPDRAGYLKFDQPASRFALAGVFVAQYGAEFRVAVTGASEDGVFRWSAAEEALAAGSAEALAAVDLSPDGLIGDLHATPAYRASLVKTLTKRVVAAFH